MILNVYVNDRVYAIDVPAEVLREGEDFFAKMDHDMDRGWQMSRIYVEHPTTLQRCQIAADKILTALHTGNKQVALLMAAYVLSRLPDVQGVRIDTNGEIFNTELVTLTPALPRKGGTPS